MGFEPQQPWSTLEMVNNFMDHMAQGLEEAKVSLTKAKDEYVIIDTSLHPSLSQATRSSWMGVILLHINCHPNCCIDNSANSQSRPVSDIVPIT
jgi:hypothetical protein